MVRRGDKLREHILWTAKDLLLEQGFERTSMDKVANRAGTSKRSLYAHFTNKEKLFLAIIELVRGLFLSRLKLPGDYSVRPEEALTLFCGRYLEVLLYEGSIQMCRISMAESGRFPEQSAQYFDVLFTQVHARLNAYLKATFSLSGRISAEAAHRLMSDILYPRFSRALFGMDHLAERFDVEALAPDFDLKPIRKAVADMIASLPVS
jgi:AcrR family transcriptional regulator